MRSTNRKLICVIGGGPSGLAAIKECVDQQLDVICYEKTDNIGGLWRYRNEDMKGVPSVNKSTLTITSKEMTAFSDFVPPAEFPNYLDHNYLCKYFEMYAEHNNLISKINFNHEVLNVTFNDDFDVTGKWKVTVRNCETSVQIENVFDGVMICTGHHIKPHIPKFPGQENFRGKIIHTSSYKTSKHFDDKVAVVVGLGNSGADAAVELSRVCKKVYLVVRKGCWVQTRVNRRGYPVDTIVTTKFMSFLRSFIPNNIYCWLYEAYVNSYFDHEMYGLKPKHRITEQSPTASDLLAISMLSGKILVRKNIERFTENGVIFEGIDTETITDVVVLATGYDIDIQFLDTSIALFHKNKLELFKYQYLPTIKHPQTLAFIGFVQPTGALFPVAEMQSRWYSLVMTGKRKLPSNEEMEQTVKRDTRRVRSAYYESNRHMLQVNYLSFLDEIATFVGCKPNMYRLVFTDPKLWLTLFFGPSMPYQYRLTGPNEWKGARQAILDYDRRIRAALKA